MRSTDIRQRPDRSERTWKISAAYRDSSTAGAVVSDLVRAGLEEADVTMMSPWPVGLAPRDGRERLLDRPGRLSLLVGVALSVVLSVIAWVWGDPDTWMTYGLIGLLMGVVSGALTSALTASSPPHWHDRLLGDPLGAVTIEVSTTRDDSADVARVVMAHHDPSLVQTHTEAGPRPPAEHVLWEHEEGQTPLEALGSWMEGKETAAAAPRRGRHLEADRVRG